APTGIRQQYHCWVWALNERRLYRDDPRHQTQIPPRRRPRAVPQRGAIMTDFARYRPHGDGVTDDSAAFLRALADMQASSAAGAPAFLDIPTGRYRISFKRSNDIQVDPLDPNYAPYWSFYNFDSEAWGPCAPPADVHSPSLRPIKIRGN